MKYRKAKKADLDQVVRVASTAFEDYLFLKVIKDLVRDPKQYPAFVEAMMRILVKFSSTIFALWQKKMMKFMQLPCCKRDRFLFGPIS